MSDEVDMDFIEDDIIVDEIFRRGLEKQVYEESISFLGHEYSHLLTKEDIEYIINCIEKENTSFTTKRTLILNSLYQLRREIN